MRFLELHFSKQAVTMPVMVTLYATDVPGQLAILSIITVTILFILFFVKLSKGIITSEGHNTVAHYTLGYLHLYD